MQKSTLIRRGKLSDRLYNDLLNGILNGDFKPGDALPTELRLANDYGISRSTVRSALAQLKTENYVVSVQGSGTIVVEQSTNRIEPFAPLDSLADLRKCFECRLTLEAETARLSAELRTDDDVTDLRDHLSRFEELVESREIHSAEDTEFHIRLAAISGNQFYESIMISIRPHIMFGMNLSKTLSHPARKRHVLQSLGEHREIVGAICDSDPTAARDAMSNHIRQNQHRLFGAE